MNLRFLKSKKILVVLALAIVSSILWNTLRLFDGFRAQEELKMEILADAYFQFNKATPDDDISLLVKIIENNKTIPMIVTDEKGKILLDQNIEYKKSAKKKVLAKKLKEMKSLHAPIEINVSDNNNQYIYYSNSEILDKLRYYPLALILIFLIFLWVLFAVFNASNNADKNKLWNGMAKETAHQIGTPLSSLLGWIEILKSENINPTYVDEIQKDVDRLGVIANRFSKIGSEPTKVASNVSLLIQETIDYFQSRSSKNIVFSYQASASLGSFHINPELFSWVLENLIKNAIDAMQGRGKIHIELRDNPLEMQILITDTGKGIPKNLHKTIFAPGYTTKERGWGLGLSLSKRIIEQYHKGKIFVKQSQKDIGTTFQINFPKKQIL
ncbi:ATP-binding protein [Ochrovirga pacifica]|uniref:ATP-binding protein n=1 Tax=Ochrovirga pacifica TaxID=1042376 RepID=UPI0002FB2EB4|nr:HAMP domain-containing sensor histidine kinase [Ochrovirga pacifica]